MKRNGPLGALIVDDERPARQWLSELLGSHPEIRVIAEADSVASARQRLSEVQPDVVFLDIQMPPDTGFSLLPYLPRRTKLVFVTAYEGFAVKAFEAHALDYLLKPVHPQRLAATVARLWAPRAASQPDAAPAGNVPQEIEGTLDLQDLLPLRDRGVLQMIPVKQLAAIRSEGSYTRLLVSGQAPLMVLHSISDWEKRLPTPPFVRLDRSRILNLSKVVQAQALDRNCSLVTLEGIDGPFRLGREASRRLRQSLRGGVTPVQQKLQQADING